MSSPAKNRLGRGLGNLISGGKTASAPGAPASAAPPLKAPPPTGLAGFAEISVASVEPGKHQPRRSFDEAGLKELADSIRSEGLLQPIVVRRAGDKYQLIAGERRWRACQLVGLKIIPARVVEASDQSSAVMAMIENLQRADLNPIEEALGYASLLRDFSLTQEAIAERVGKARTTVANALRLLALEREVQGYLAKGLLSTGHAKVLLGLADEGQRVILARRSLEDGWCVREIERQARKVKAEAAPRAAARPGSEAEMATLRDVEKRIAAKLNTRVSLKHKPKHGRIVIEYFGNEDLQRILERIGVGS
jgi:ParB family chromosome partitioning protein